jgi:tetratricopeptide (TPR) repeat protein
MPKLQGNPLNPATLKWVFEDTKCTYCNGAGGFYSQCINCGGSGKVTVAAVTPAPKPATPAPAQNNAAASTAAFDRGNAAFDRNDYNKAIAEYTEAVRLDPNAGGAYYNRGQAYIKKGDYDRAIEDYTQVIRIVPNYAAAYRMRSNSYVQRGLELKKREDIKNARADLEKAKQLDPNNKSNETLETSIKWAEQAF